MSFLRKLLAGLSQTHVRTAPEEPRYDRVAAVVAQMKARAQPCLRLVTGGSGRSRLGGSPEMTGPWPHYAGEPLSFIAQLDLAEMRAAGGPAWLPEQGRLLFFYLVDGGGWGFDPEDAGSFLVRHEIDPAAPADYPANLAEDLRFPALPLTFVAAESLPDSESLDLGADELSGKEERALEDALSKMTPPEPAHQVGGYASPIQGDRMALECQLVTNGLNVGSPKGYQAQEVEGLRAGAADWRLLLQVDTDNEAGMMWGDMGRIYFWIREQDARAADFAKAWMILQCY